jgi:hypothetical protein
MSKDTTITAQRGESQGKPRVATPSSSKSAASNSRTSKPKSVKPKSAKAKSRVQAKTVATEPAKAAGKKAAKSVAKASSKAAKTKAAAEPAKKHAKKPAGVKPVSAKPAAPAKAGVQENVRVSGLSLGRSLQLTMPVAAAVNTKLFDMAHSNVSAGLELARDLAGAKTPMEAMRLGVAYWFNHLGAVQAQARELQSLSAAWVKTASQQIRTF